MNICIAGSGELATRHINFARAYAGGEVIGIIDENPNRAKLTAETNNVPWFYTSIREQIDVKKPDIVHVMLPPGLQYDICKQAISSGCSVLVYSPFTENYERASELFKMAKEKGVGIYVLNDSLLTATSRKLKNFRSTINSNNITRIECHCGLQEDQYKLRSYVKPNILHWYHSLPGNIYQKYLADLLHVVFPYLTDNYSICVQEKSSGILPRNMTDEIDVELSTDEKAFYFNLSLLKSRKSSYIRLFSQELIITLDLISGSMCIEHPIQKVGTVSVLVKKLRNQTSRFSYSIRRYIYRSFIKAGIRKDEEITIHHYYDSAGRAVEVNPGISEALSINRLLDKVNQKLSNVKLDLNNYIPPVENLENAKGTVLVTGGTGLFGNNLVKRLSKDGYRVRVLARKLSNIESLKSLNVEIFYGDVACPSSLKVAIDGADYVVHAAADTEALKGQGLSNTVVGTSNIINLAKSKKVKKLVYVSSCSVYEVSGYQQGDIIDETGKIERFPEKRGGYSYAKITAEEIVRSHIKDSAMHVVCVRPGTYVGPGKYIFTPIVGVSLKNKLFIIFDREGLVLPLIYYENVSDSIVTIINARLECGDIYNLVDDHPVTKKEYVELFLEKLYPDAKFIYVPYWLIYSMVALQELILSTLQKAPFITRYRLISSQNPVTYDSRKIRKQLSWTPPYTLSQAFEKIINTERNIEGKQ